MRSIFWSDSLVRRIVSTMSHKRRTLASRKVCEESEGRRVWIEKGCGEEVKEVGLIILTEAVSDGCWCCCWCLVAILRGATRMGLVKKEEEGLTMPNGDSDGAV